MARGTDDAPTRMGSRAAKIEPTNRRPIAGPPGHGTEGEHLIRQNRTMEDVAPREAVFPLHVERRSPPHRNHCAADVRGVALEDVEDPVRERFRLGLPGTARQVERSELRGYGERVLSRGRDGLIVRRLEDEFEERFSGRLASPR